MVPRVFAYGEDGLTLKTTKERLGEILHELGDKSNPSDCAVFFRPSLGRGTTGYGEFDAIIISPKKAYIVEAKWDDKGRKKKISRLEENQIRRHDILKWLSQNWDGEEEWDTFAEKYNPEFEEEFTLDSPSKEGAKVAKSIQPLHKDLGQNTHIILEEIGNNEIEDVLLIFYRDKKPKVEENRFSIVFIRYNLTFGLFTELE